MRQLLKYKLSKTFWPVKIRFFTYHRIPTAIMGMYGIFSAFIKVAIHFPSSSERKFSKILFDKGIRNNIFYKPELFLIGINCFRCYCRSNLEDIRVHIIENRTVMPLGTQT